MFSPDIVRYSALIRKAKRKEYHYQQQVYYSNLLKEILVNRQVWRKFAEITFDNCWLPILKLDSDMKYFWIVVYVW